MAARAGHRSTRRALRLAAGGLVVGSVVAGAGVAGAAQQAADATITTDNSTAFIPPATSVNTGDTVTWNFAAGVHNAQSSNEVAADPNWTDFATPVPSTGTYAYTFTQPGTYDYLCSIHAGMTGTVTVTGAPVTPTPTPPGGTPSPEPSATPPPTAQPPAPSATPRPPADTTTPAPGGAARDGAAPAISQLSLKAVGHRARVSLALSETATVTVRVRLRKSGRVVRTARLQVRAGKRRLTLPGVRLRRGRYVVELVARDSGGNVAPVRRAGLRVGRERG